MGHARRVSIPIYHVLAEVAAFPVASVSAMRLGIIELDFSLADTSRTARLWREGERDLVRAFPSFSIDEAVAIRDRVWFHKQESQQSPARSLKGYLAATAQRYLHVDGGIARPRLFRDEPRHDSSPAEWRRAWRWLCFAMPVEPLLAALDPSPTGPIQVEVVTPPVDALLRERGFAEMHVHQGAALDFPTVWAAALHQVAHVSAGKVGMPWNKFQSPAAEFDDGLELASWLVRAALARLLLANFLSGRASGQCRWNTFLDMLEEYAAAPSLSSHAAQASYRALRDLGRGQLSSVLSGHRRLPSPRQRDLQSSFLEIQICYNEIAGCTTRRSPARLHDCQALDPLSRWFPAHERIGPSVELQFLRAAFRYLDANPQDRYFALLFWQVVRVRGLLYRHCVQRPLTPGLQNFIRFYERKGAVTPPLSDVEIESAGVLAGVGSGLKSLEVRIRPDDDADAQARTLKRAWKSIGSLRNRRADAAPRSTDPGDWRDVEFGIVLHFLKGRGKRTDLGYPHAWDRDSEADPRYWENTYGYRWSNYFVKQMRQADAIATAVRRDPSLLYLVRGIDVCRDEAGVPSWVIAPLFRNVRRAVQRASAAWQEIHRRLLPPLRTTAHVGEDFVHLLSGLRCMGEVLDRFDMQTGDRIGHGLALGVEPLTWAEKTVRVLLPREERWFDLIWEWRWHAAPESDFAADRHAFVEQKIQELGEKIFVGVSDYPKTPFQAARFVDSLYNEEGMLEKSGFPSREMAARGNRPELNWITQYLTSARIFEEARKLEWVETLQEGPAIMEMQRLVRLKLAALGITIEVNPISNLLVGDLGDLVSHPLWRLSPPQHGQVENPLRVCIGSDDPFPFVTNLREEYQFLHDAIILANRSHVEARAWLDRARQTGLETRFTDPETLDRQRESYDAQS